MGTYKKVKVFLTEDALTQLEDAYLDKEDELRKLIFNKVKELAKGGKMCKIQKNFAAQIWNPEEKKFKQEVYSLKKERLEDYDPGDNPEWIPKEMDKEDTKYYALQVGDKTWEYLVVICQVLVARITKFNESLDMSREDHKEQKMELPECREQIFHEQLIQLVTGKIMESVADEFEEEFKEINKSEDEKKKEPKKKEPAKDLPGSRKQSTPEKPKATEKIAV